MKSFYLLNKEGGNMEEFGKNNCTIDELIKFIDTNFIDSNEEIDKLENCKLLIEYIYQREIEIDETIVDTLLNNCPKLMILAEFLSKNKDLIDCEYISLIVDVYEFRKKQESLDFEELRENQKYNYYKGYSDDNLNGDLDILDMYVREINLPLLSLEEEKDLLEKLQNGDIEALHKFVTHNLKLVMQWAKYFRSVHVPYLDIIQAGNEGLILAAKKFDINSSNKFSTYATYWIKQRIALFLNTSTRNISIPVEWNRRIIKIKKFIKEYEMNYGEFPTILEISTALGYEPHIIEELMIYFDDTNPLSEVIIEDSSEFENEIMHDMYLKKVREAFEETDGLTEKEKEVLAYRYGLFDGKLRTLEEIANIYNVGRERIRQIEGKALRKLKSPYRKFYQMISEFPYELGLRR